MHKWVLTYSLLILLPLLLGEAKGEKMIKLPKPETKGKVSLEEAINRRGSVRNYSSKPLTMTQLSQILWAAGGKRVDAATEASRTIPSAGALYPLEIFVLAGKVENLKEGLYQYHHIDHSLGLLKEDDLRKELSRSAWGQDFLAQAPVDLVVVAEPSRTTDVYGERGERYIQIEVGHLGQNVSLQAEALGLSTCAVGAFDDDGVSKVLGLKKGLIPLYILPLGYRK
jgi:SagB-type dehydrogenase family enzyme